jgi:hypothetical protein
MICRTFPNVNGSRKVSRLDLEGRRCLAEIYLRLEWKLCLPVGILESRLLLPDLG